MAMGGFFGGWKSIVGVLVLVLVGMAIANNFPAIGDLTKKRG